MSQIVVWLLLGFIILWVLVYAFNPFAWEFLEEIGGGFLRKRRGRSQSLVEIIAESAGDLGAVTEPLTETLDEMRIYSPRTVEEIFQPVSLKEVESSLGGFQRRNFPMIIFPSSSKYVEIAHGEMRVEDSLGREHVLYGWGGKPPDFDLVKRFAREIHRIVLQEEWRFDTICTMSIPALPLAYSYMFVVGEEFRVVECDNITGNFFPEEFLREEHSKKILLLDGNVQTGAHVERTWRALAGSQARHEVVGFLAVIRNDRLISPEKPSDFLLSLIAEEKAQSIFLVSELLKESERVRAARSAPKAG